MTETLAPDVLEDGIAVSLARTMAAANTHARGLGVDVYQSVITVTRCFTDGPIWRVNYGPKDYVGRRGGDVIIDVDPDNASIHRVLRGQ